MSLRLETIPSPLAPLPGLQESLHVVDIAVAQVARRLPAHVAREDLASAGKIALVGALRQFEGPGEQAHAYAYMRVRGAILDELRRLDPLSRRTRAKVTHLRRVSADLAQELGRAPTRTEVAEASGLPPAVIRRAQIVAEAAESPVSLEARQYEDGTPRELPDAGSASPADEAERGDASAALEEALGRLPANQAFVLRRYHYEGATLEEIAGEIGVSKERVRQIREAGERRLRADATVASLAGSRSFETCAV